MAKRRSYDDKFRASAVVMLEAAGYPETKGALMRVAAELKVPAMTLSRWFRGSNNPPPNELVTEKGIDLKAALWGEIGAILGDMPIAREFAEYRDLGTVLGILFDKLQLLENKPTGIVEHTFTEEQRTERIAEILNSARTRRTGRSADKVQ